MSLFRSSWPLSADLARVSTHAVTNVRQRHLVHFWESTYAQVLAALHSHKARHVHGRRRVVRAEHEVTVHGRRLAERVTQSAKNNVRDRDVRTRGLAFRIDVLLRLGHVQLQRAEDHATIWRTERRDHHLASRRHDAGPEVQLQREVQDQQKHQQQMHTARESDRLERKDRAAELNSVRREVVDRVVPDLRYVKNDTVRRIIMLGRGLGSI